MLKNLIFDVGEVLFEYRWLYPLELSGVTDEEERKRIGREMFQDPIWVQMDLGQVSLEEAKRYYAEKYPKDAKSMAGFLDRVDKIRIDRPRVWEKLPKLKKKGYKIFLLSNYPKELFEEHISHFTFRKELDGMVVSYQVHLVKPDPQIYRSLLKKYDLQAEECLFLDDREENVKAARELGFDTFQVKSQVELLEKLDSLLS